VKGLTGNRDSTERGAHFRQSPSIKDLRERWKTLYGKEPSSLIGRSFLIRAIAYRLQEKAFGGLKPSTRLLARSAEDIAAETR
jgi:hypothetical protein